MRIILVIALATILSCISSFEPINCSGKYKSKNGQLTIDLTHKGDSIIATHCFVLNQGNTIECCLDDISINTKQNISDDSFNGYFHSCYDEDDHPIKLSFNKDTLFLELKKGYVLFSLRLLS